jgi:uncharacterized protein (DUF1800 family)
MNAFKIFLTPFGVVMLAGLAVAQNYNYNDPSPPSIAGITSESNAQRRISFTPYPSADQFKMLRTDSLGSPWFEDLSGIFSGLTWSFTPQASNSFFRLQVVPLSSNALLTANVANKLAYGPTPDLLDRLAVIGPEAYIAEQLAPETITENVANTHTNINIIAAKLGTPPNIISATATTGPATATMNDMRAWYMLQAVGADRQLYEILTQFFDNHFTTEYAKAVTFLTRYNFPGLALQRFGVEMEWRELYRWRQALLSPTCTFSNLLTISAESPTMIIYLDTVDSRGDGRNIANENYSRELLELFTMGVDNGYDQNDIVAMSTCWAGWSLELVAPDQANNPFAPRTTAFLPGSTSTSTAFTNLYGIWSFNFKPNRHGTAAKTIFPDKYVPARFGPPYTTRTYGNNSTPGLYQLNIPSRLGTSGIQDGYDVIAHLANLPFTQEYISVKLCRTFVHDDFTHGYDFTDPNLSEEGKLVKACMAAWENSSPPGQIRPVLQTIFNSALFRGPGSYAQKVKTPLEFIVSAIRALRSSTNGSGTMASFTARTDGYGLVTTNNTGRSRLNDGGIGSPLSRLGDMILFNREAPDGWPETAPAWINASSLAERSRYLESLLTASGIADKNDQNPALVNNVTDPVGLLRHRLPSVADQKDAGKVADLFLGYLYPGEGKASLDEYRTAAINWLNTADNGLGVSSFNSLTPSSVAGSAYDTRVRSMVGMLLNLDRFHEQ